MGNAVVIEAPCEVDMISSEHTRSIFGDILSPIESIVTGALNEFKGPVGDIMGIVMNSVVGTIIQDLLNFAESLLGGFISGFEVDTSLITEPLRLIPIIASIIREGIQSATTAIHDVGDVVDTTITDYIKLVQQAFQDFKQLNNFAINTSQTIVGKMCTAMNALTGSTDITSKTAGLSSYVSNIVGELQSELTVIDSRIGSIVTYAASEVCSEFAKLSDDIFGLIRQYITDISSIATTIVDQLSREISLVGNQVTAGGNAVLNEVSSGIGALTSAIDEVPSIVSHSVGSALTVSRDASQQARAYIDRETSTAQKQLVRTGDSAKRASKAIARVINYIDHSTWVIAGGLLLVLLLLMIFAYRDIKRSRTPSIK